MMIPQKRTTREAFSLLEVVIALAIGTVLLAALYATLSTQVTMTQAGRDTVQEGTLARSILTRLSNDIMSQVGPYDPRMVNDPTAAAATTTTTTAAAAPVPVVTYNNGVYGTATMLRLATYRVQAAPPGAITGTVDPNIETVSDLRRVSYWLATNGADTQGLARKEFRQAINDPIDTDPTTLPDQLSSVIAKEVLNITFEYFDGTTWQTEWDGTALLSDDVTPMGPPLAIRITLVLRRNASRGRGTTDASNDQGPSYQHVVALPAVNFVTQ